MKMVRLKTDKLLAVNGWKVTAYRAGDLVDNLSNAVAAALVRNGEAVYIDRHVVMTEVGTANPASVVAAESGPLATPDVPTERAETSPTPVAAESGPPATPTSQEAPPERTSGKKRAFKAPPTPTADASASEIAS